MKNLDKHLYQVLLDITKGQDERWLYSSILFKDKKMIATDGRCLFVTPKEYPSEMEGKIINPRNLSFEDYRSFPDYTKVIPNKEICKNIEGMLLPELSLMNSKNQPDIQKLFINDNYKFSGIEPLNENWLACISLKYLHNLRTFIKKGIGFNVWIGTKDKPVLFEFFGSQYILMQVKV